MFFMIAFNIIHKDYLINLVIVLLFDIQSCEVQFNHSIDL